MERDCITSKLDVYVPDLTSKHLEQYLLATQPLE